MITIDFHVHSVYSRDSIMKPEEIIAIAKREKLDGVAITDHNTILGAIAAKKVNSDKNFEVIIGEEISTDIGDVLALFIKKEIKEKKIERVYEEVKRQGGILILAHPYRKKTDYTKKTLYFFDGIEIFNSRSRRRQNFRAEKLAKSLGKLLICGSDAHLSWEIGKCRNIFHNKNIREELKKKKNRISCKYSNYLINHSLSWATEKFKRLIITK